MRIVSIDIETLGLDPDKHDMIEFGAVDCDLATQLDTPLAELPSFRALLRKDIYHGSPYAMAMNASIMKEISDEEERLRKGEEKVAGLFYPHEFVRAFENWLLSIGYQHSGSKIYITPAGKNFSSFDLQFLKRQVPKLFETVHMSHRVADPAILFCDLIGDSRIPDFKTCLERSGSSCEVAHTAVQDALDVVEMLRHAAKNHLK